MQRCQDIRKRIKDKLYPQSDDKAARVFICNVLYSQTE